MGNSRLSSNDTLTIESVRSVSPLGDMRRDRTAASSSRKEYDVRSQRPQAELFVSAAPEAKLKTRGEIEAAVCDGIRQIQREYLGRGPEDVHAHLVCDLVILRLFGVLTLAERQLVKSIDCEKGRDLVKQVRTQLIESARPLMETLILEATGVPLSCMHHDLSTTYGEECFVFTLAAVPQCRDICKSKS